MIDNFLFIDFRQTMGIISGIVVFLAFVPYIISTIKKESRPHPTTWVLWTFITGVAMVQYWDIGARETIWLAFASFLGQLVIAFVSIRYWDQGFDKFEYMCAAVSVLSIFIWILSGSPSVALSFNLVADFIASLPTIKNTWYYPINENLLTWGMFVFGNMLSLVAIKSWSFGVALLPVYLVLLSVTILSLSVIRRKFVVR